MGHPESCKAPGPDGFTAEFFKKMSVTILPHLHKVITYALENEEFPQTMCEAVLTDPKDVGSHCPLSLLNLDSHIFSKVLALRLNKVISKIIHSDQTGFIPNHHSFFNLRHLFNVLYTTRKPDEDLVIAALDAEKAFDQLEWNYLFSVLHKFHLGKDLIKWIQL